MSLMLFLPLSELVKSAGAWRRRARRTRLTRSDKERSPDKALLHPCVLPLALLPPVSPLCLTSVSLFFFPDLPPSVSICLFPHCICTPYPLSRRAPHPPPRQEAPPPLSSSPAPGYNIFNLLQEPARCWWLWLTKFNCITAVSEPSPGNVKVHRPALCTNSRSFCFLWPNTREKTFKTSIFFYVFLAR